jgi:Growth regulator
MYIHSIYFTQRYKMQAVVQKWGNSLGIRIPSAYAQDFNLRNGSTVEILQDQGKIVICPKKQSLDDLVSRITDANRHEETDTGFSMGNEAW